MSDLSWILLCLAFACFVLEVFIPSGGLLLGAGLGLLIERALDAAGVSAMARWPMAGVGLFVGIGLAARYGERLSDRLFPARIKTGVDRMVGLECRVRRAEGALWVVDIEGDLWTARLADGEPTPAPGEGLVVVGFVEQVPIIGRELS